MKTILLLLLPALSWSYPGPQINGDQINPQSGINISTLTVTGTNGLSVTGQVTASTYTATGSFSWPISNGGTALSSAGGTSNRVLRTSNGTTFAMGQVIGPDIAASTVPLRSLNQSGATDGQVIGWSGANSQWQPSNAGISGGIAGAVPVYSGATALSPNGFITSVSTGVAISTNVTIGIAGSTGAFPGNNNFSGSNTFSGAVKITSGSCVGFSPTLGFTSSQNSFNAASTITGSTVTWTQQGTRAACWFGGSVASNASNFSIMGFGCDGKNIGLQTTTTGVVADVTNSGGRNMSWPPYEFTTTAGQHSCYLGLWVTGSQTDTFPAGSSVSAPQFCCREVSSQ